MAGFWSEHLENIDKDFGDTIVFIKRYTFFSFILILVLCCLLKLEKPTVDANISLQFLALIISLIALFSSIIFSGFFYSKNLTHFYNVNLITKNDIQLKNIQENINLFYLPLSVLLTVPDQPENAQAIAQKTAEINCNKHLAEPEVRAVFESYMKGNKDPKLSELVYRDIETLQKQYAEEKQKLTGK